MGIPDPVRDSQFYQGVPMRRLMAFAIDTVVILALWFMALMVVALISVATMGLGAALGFFVLSATGFVYRALMVAQRSATLGMMATGIEIRDANGNKATQGIAILHTAGYYVTFFFVPLLIIGWFLMASDPYRRVMHDKFFGTVVINRPA